MKLLTPENISEAFQLPLSTVHRLAREGKIPGARKIGRLWRFSEEAIKDWLGGKSEEQSIVQEVRGIARQIIDKHSRS